MWGIQRRLFILCVVAFAILFVITVPIYVVHLFQEPLCTDTRQNGLETGVDCGGSCPFLCSAQQEPLTIEWARVVAVTDTVYSLAFSVQNQNFSSFAYRAPYSCKITDNNYGTIDTVSGVTSISSSGNYIVTRNSLMYKDKKPVHIQCAFEKKYKFTSLPKKSLANAFAFDGFVNKLDSVRPTVSANVHSNDILRTFYNSRFVATVYDATGTAVAVSETVIDNILPNTRYPLVYTWPNSFVGVKPFRVELTPLFEFPEYKVFEKDF